MPLISTIHLSAVSAGFKSARDIESFIAGWQHAQSGGQNDPNESLAYRKGFEAGWNKFGESPIALSGNWQPIAHHVKGTGPGNAPVSFNVQSDGAVGKNDAAQHVPVGTKITTQTDDGERQFIVDDNKIHQHLNMTVPTVTQTGGTGIQPRTGQGGNEPGKLHLGHIGALLALSRKNGVEPKVAFHKPPAAAHPGAPKTPQGDASMVGEPQTAANSGDIGVGGDQKDTGNPGAALSADPFSQVLVAFARNNVPSGIRGNDGVNHLVGVNAIVPKDLDGGIHGEDSSVNIGHRVGGTHPSILALGSPDEQRVPAGSPDGGQWAGGHDFRQHQTYEGRKFVAVHNVDPSVIDFKPGDASAKDADLRAVSMVDAIKQGDSLPPPRLMLKPNGRFEVRDGNARTVAYRKAGKKIPAAILVDKDSKEVPELPSKPLSADADIIALSADGTHKFSSTQIDMPDDIAARVKAMAARIPDEHLADDGRSDGHVTLKYGLHDTAPEGAGAVLADEPPIKMKFGKTSLFPANDKHDYDVVKIDVDSPDLHRLNKKVADALPHTDTFPVYSPHMTVACVKRGLGNQYAGIADLDGTEATANAVTFSSKDGTRTSLPLGGVKTLQQTIARAPADGNPDVDASIRDPLGRQAIAAAGDQPRVPAGSPDGGEFGSGGGARAGSMADARKAGAKWVLPLKKLSKQDMIDRGADGFLDHAYEATIPIEKISGHEPVPQGETPYTKGRKVTQPIETVYDHSTGTFVLHGGNHRVEQARVNGDTHIPAFVQVSGRTALDGDTSARGWMLDASPLAPPSPVPMGLAGLPTYEEVPSDEVIGKNADGSPKFKMRQVPVAYYDKEIARIGDWTHRAARDELSGEPMTFSITDGDARELMDNYKELRRNGVVPHIPDYHIHAWDRKKNNGQVIDLNRKGKSLIGRLKLVGSDAIEKALKNDVSVYILNGDAEPVVDAHGNRYKGRVLAHVCVTGNPCLPLDPQWHPVPNVARIAASADGGEVYSVPVYLPAGMERPLALEAADQPRDYHGRWTSVGDAEVGMDDAGGNDTGRVVAGPHHLIGKTREEVEAHGAPPAKEKVGYHRIARNAKGDYVGTVGEGRKIEHIAEHGERIKALRAQPGNTALYLNKNPADHDSAQVLTTDSKGRQQSIYTDDHKKAAKIDKWAREKELNRRFPEIAAKLASDPSEEAAALRLISTTGLRIGGSGDTGAEEQAYGATTLLPKHVKVDDNGKVTLKFVGKKGVRIVHNMADEAPHSEVISRANSGNPKQKLYNTSDNKTRDFMHKIAPVDPNGESGGQQLLVKDFRTRIAGIEARAEMGRAKASPKSAKEYEGAVKKVAEHVSSRLGNTPAVAIKDYINPDHLRSWQNHLANHEQAGLIKDYAKANNLDEGAAAKEWIGKHAAGYRANLNERLDKQPGRVAPLDRERFGGLPEQSGRDNLRAGAAKSRATGSSAGGGGTSGSGRRVAPLSQQLRVGANAPIASSLFASGDLPLSARLRISLAGEAQPRVPAGSSGGGEWSRTGSMDTADKAAINPSRGKLQDLFDAAHEKYGTDQSGFREGEARGTILRGVHDERTGEHRWGAAHQYEHGDLVHGRDFDSSPEGVAKKGNPYRVSTTLMRNKDGRNATPTRLYAMADGTIRHQETQEPYSVPGIGPKLERAKPSLRERVAMDGDLPLSQKLKIKPANPVKDERGQMKMFRLSGDTVRMTLLEAAAHFGIRVDGVPLSQMLRISLEAGQRPPSRASQSTRLRSLGTKSDPKNDLQAKDSEVKSWKGGESRTGGSDESGPVYFRTINGVITPLHGTDPDPAESARWESHRAAEIDKAMTERKAKAVHVKTKSGSHIVEHDDSSVHHTTPEGKTASEEHDSHDEARKGAAAKAAKIEAEAQKTGSHVATETAVPIDEEVAAGIKAGKVSVPTEGGQVDPHLAEAYERHAANQGHKLGEWKIDKETGEATATLTKAGETPKAAATAAAPKESNEDANNRFLSALRKTGNSQSKIFGETANGTKVEITPAAFGRVTATFKGQAPSVLGKDGETEIPVNSLHALTVDGKTVWERNPQVAKPAALTPKIDTSRPAAPLSPAEKKAAGEAFAERAGWKKSEGDAAEPKSEADEVNERLQGMANKMNAESEAKPKAGEATATLTKGGETPKIEQPPPSSQGVTNPVHGEPPTPKYIYIDRPTRPDDDPRFLSRRLHTGSSDEDFRRSAAKGRDDARSEAEKAQNHGIAEPQQNVREQNTPDTRQEESNEPATPEQSKGAAEAFADKAGWNERKPAPPAAKTDVDEANERLQGMADKMNAESEAKRNAGRGATAPEKAADKPEADREEKLAPEDLASGDSPAAIRARLRALDAKAQAKKDDAKAAEPKAEAKEPDGEEPADAEDHEVKSAPADIGKVNQRIERLKKFFRAKGDNHSAGFLEKAQKHINEVGVEKATEELGEEKGVRGGATYVGAAISDDEKQPMSAAGRAYLQRNGIQLAESPVEADRNFPVVSVDTRDAGQEHEDDSIAAEPKIKNKLEEAKYLPGLEKSEAVPDGVTHLTPEVMKGFDEKFGNGKWVAKPYGENGIASEGVFFPQRAQKIMEDAQGVVQQAGEELGKYGFELDRDAGGKAIGIKHSSGDTYKFGTDKYNNTINGSAREWGDKAAQAADNEHGAALAGGGKEYMVQPAFDVVGTTPEERAAGALVNKNEGGVHIVTKDGVASAVPGATWLKNEYRPQARQDLTRYAEVFHTPEIKAMEQAAVDAINKMPKSERMGQIYRPDVVKTTTGYKVVEANPTAEGAGSAMLTDDPHTIDAVVSHALAKDPAHVTMLRNILRKKEYGTDTARGSGAGSKGRSGSSQSNDAGSGGKTVDSELPGHSGPQAKFHSSVSPQAAESPEALSVALKGAGLKERTPVQYRTPGQEHKAYQYNNGALIDAAKKSGAFIEPEKLASAASGPNVGGFEHDVHLDPQSKRYYKFTKAGPDLGEGDVHRYLDSASALSELAPDLGLKVHGITQSPFTGKAQVVTSVNQIKGTHPEDMEVERHLKKKGWEPIDNEDTNTQGMHDSWRDPKTGTEIRDVHGGNWIKTPSGKMVPIDMTVTRGHKAPQALSADLPLSRRLRISFAPAMPLSRKLAISN